MSRVFFLTKFYTYFCTDSYLFKLQNSNKHHVILRALKSSQITLDKTHKHKYPPTTRNGIERPTTAMSSATTALLIDSDIVRLAQNCGPTSLPLPSYLLSPDSHPTLLSFLCSGFSSPSTSLAVSEYTVSLPSLSSYVHLFTSLLNLSPTILISNSLRSQNPPIFLLSPPPCPSDLSHARN